MTRLNIFDQQDAARVERFLDVGEEGRAERERDVVKHVTDYGRIVGSGNGGEVIFDERAREQANAFAVTGLEKFPHAIGDIDHRDVQVRAQTEEMVEQIAVTAADVEDARIGGEL